MGHKIRVGTTGLDKQINRNYSKYIDNKDFENKKKIKNKKINK